MSVNSNISELLRTTTENSVVLYNQIADYIDKLEAENQELKARIVALEEQSLGEQ